MPESATVLRCGDVDKHSSQSTAQPKPLTHQTQPPGSRAQNEAPKPRKSYGWMRSSQNPMSKHGRLPMPQPTVPIPVASLIPCASRLICSEAFCLPILASTASVAIDPKMRSTLGGFLEVLKMGATVASESPRWTVSELRRRSTSHVSISTTTGESASRASLPRASEELISSEAANWCQLPVCFSEVCPLGHLPRCGSREVAMVPVEGF